MPQLSEAEVLALFHECSNEGRWGDHDERGTLNFVTSEVTATALRLPRRGAVVSIGKDLPTSTASVPPQAVHMMMSAGYGSFSSQDAFLVVNHGFENTHLDAVGHSFFDGTMYNGRAALDHATAAGLTFGSIKAMADGIVTRGILLDVAAVRGVEYLPPGEGVSVADLEAAEARAKVAVRSGDAILVRTGHDLRVRREGPEAYDFREGILPEVVPWMHRKEIAVYGGDCIDRIPSGYPRVPLPMHQIGHSAMGLAILDVPDIERLSDACREFDTNEFVLMIAPLRLPGGTGSPVNPLAIF